MIYLVRSLKLLKLQNILKLIKTIKDWFKLEVL